MLLRNRKAGAILWNCSGRIPPAVKSLCQVHGVTHFAMWSGWICLCHPNCTFWEVSAPSPGTQLFCLGDISEEKLEKLSLASRMCIGVAWVIPKNITYCSSMDESMVVFLTFVGRHHWNVILSVTCLTPFWLLSIRPQLDIQPPPWRFLY